MGHFVWAILSCSPKTVCSIMSLNISSICIKCCSRRPFVGSLVGGTSRSVCTSTRPRLSSPVYAHSWPGNSTRRSCMASSRYRDTSRGGRPKRSLGSWRWVLTNQIICYLKSGQSNFVLHIIFWLDTKVLKLTNQFVCVQNMCNLTLHMHYWDGYTLTIYFGVKLIQ